MEVLFVDADGNAVDQRSLSHIPRMGEGIHLDDVRFYVGAVQHVIDHNGQTVVVTILKHEEARRFLGGGSL